MFLIYFPATFLLVVLSLFFRMSCVHGAYLDSLSLCFSTCFGKDSELPDTRRDTHTFFALEIRVESDSLLECLVLRCGSFLSNAFCFLECYWFFLRQDFLWWHILNLFLYVILVFFDKQVWMCSVCRRRKSTFEEQCLEDRSGSLQAGDSANNISSLHKRRLSALVSIFQLF